MRFYFETYGCTMNHGESQELALLLMEMGHEVSPVIESADVAVFNTCMVIAPTERKIRKRIQEVHGSGKGLFIIGCMASVQAQQLRSEYPGALICGTSDYQDLRPKVIETYGLGCEPIEGMDNHQLILPIAQGCNGACTYCITKLARGDLVSYPAGELVRKVEHALEQGAKEVLATSQDTASYGMDGGPRLPDLLARICAIPGDFRVRVGMMNPDNLKEILEGTSEAYRHPKVYKFLHLPVQSGSDCMIRDMGRGYSVSEYKRLVKSMREAVPELTLSTDVITGFPGETDDDHRATVALVEELRPNIINVTRFSPRPGTVAEIMKEQVPGWISKERSRELTALRFRISSEINASKLGRTYSVLIDEKGKGSSVMARSDDYTPIVIKGDHALWQRVRVRITSAASTHLYGEIVDMEN